jgi:type II secretion system protein C
MKKIDYIYFKIVDYVVNVALSDRNDNLKKRDLIYREFVTCFLLIFTLMSVTNCFVSYISYILTNKLDYLPRIKNSKTFSVTEKFSFILVQKHIMERNIFNSTGAIPFEDTQEGAAELMEKQFEQAPCSITEKIPVPVVGIIYSENPNQSLVTIKDPQVSVADVYKIGQEIIDYENIRVYKILDSRNVQFRRDKVKICVSLEPEYKTAGGMPSAMTGQNVSLTSAYVAQELGPGFSKILTSARMIPEIIDGKTVGFKVFAIAKNSLFDKIQLVNGDIIKMVNGINLKDSSQGFKVYEAFQDDTNIVLEIQRGGQTSVRRVSVQ